MEKNCWYWKNKCVETPPEGFYGFCYKITCMHPSVKTGWIYIGKKAFTHKATKVISKKQQKIRGTRKKKESTQVDSKWLSYFGSSKELNALVKQLGEEYFKREIISFALNKTDLALQEWEGIIKYNVLRIEESFNGWASGRIYKKYLHGKLLQQ